MSDKRTIEVEPKYYDFYMDNIRYRVPKPTLGFRARRWRDKARLRHAMLAVKRLFDRYAVPPIEEAHTVELVECEGGCLLRIRMDSCPESVKERILKPGERR